MNPTTAAKNRHAIRILIADADGDTRSLYEDLLTGAGCDVIQALDGRDALVKALSAPPTLLITEIHLPILSGYDLCGLLRQDSATRTLPILVVTTETRLPLLERVRAIDVNGVLIKPVEPDHLLTEIHQILEYDDPPRRDGIEFVTSRPERRRTSQTTAHLQTQTTTPPKQPPWLLCPCCERPLKYEHSFVGGVSRRHAEQWDAYSCSAACGRFEYRQRTRKLRRAC
jgi:two-component system chemotaxis response regulator CheY